MIFTKVDALVKDIDVTNTILKQSFFRAMTLTKNYSCEE